MSEASMNKRGEYGDKRERLGATGYGGLVGLGLLGVGAVLLVRHEKRDFAARMRGFK